MLYNSWKNISRTHGASEAWDSFILPPLALEGPHLGLASRKLKVKRRKAG